jgi:hypothetical protein
MGLVFGIMLTAGLPAQADTVQWLFGGVFTAIDAPWPNLQPELMPGQSFQLMVSFDSNAVLRNKLLDSDGAGYRYNFFNNSLAMHLKAGAIEGDFGNGVQQDMIVRDNYTAPGAPFNQVDGVSFGITDQFADQIQGVAIDHSFSLVMRSLNLDMLTVANDKMPSAAFSAADLNAANQFFVCRSSHSNPGACDYGALEGVITSMETLAVPEPASASLALAGLLGVGMAMRRRRT